MSELEIRKAVKERYAKMATSSDSKCCSEDECCNDLGKISVSEAVPVEAFSVGAGCGSPLLLVSPKEGDAVLDLGSGGGIDIFRLPSSLFDPFEGDLRFLYEFRLNPPSPPNNGGHDCRLLPNWAPEL